MTNFENSETESLWDGIHKQTKFIWNISVWWIGPNAIKRIFQSIKKSFEVFYKKKYIIEENAHWLYSSKTQKRQNCLEKIIRKKEFNFFQEIYINDFKVNNLKLPSIKKSFFSLKMQLINFEENRPLHLGHGDFCFNNILVDPIYGTINLIDPKAEKHEKLNLYGVIDEFYDLSKLNHSIEGLYDSVVNNLFHLKFLILITLAY